VKNRLWSFSFVASLVLGLATFGWTGLLQAQSQDQQQPQQSQPPTADQPQSQPDQTPSRPPADSPAQAQQSADSQSFTGTIVKSGDKWMFQDAASGNTYDIDHQDEVKKFEGKKVKVHGTLDADKKMIHVQ
jgi:uncharacterized protein YdeI (BOF family)